MGPVVGEHSVSSSLEPTVEFKESGKEKSELRLDV